MECCAVTGCGRGGAHRTRNDVVLCCDHFEQYVDARFHVPDGANVLDASLTAAVGKQIYLDLRVQFAASPQGERARQAMLNPATLLLSEGTTTDVEVA